MGLNKKKRVSNTAGKAKSATGARLSTRNSSLKSYFDNHLKVSKLSFKDQTDRPFATFFTCSVIGIALVLPTLLAILLSNVQATSLDWDGSAKITLFLKNGTSAIKGGQLTEQLRQKDNIVSSQFVDKVTALSDFKSQFKLDNVIEYLDINPLPHAIIVTPNPLLKSVEQIEQLRQHLTSIPEVESALMDVVWVQRLQSITSFLERAIWVIALMLAIAVLLILGNTIRLAIENRKEEIAVLKLVGGTTAFVCRPFLYMGVIYGVGGSIVAIILTHIILAILYLPVQELAVSYQSNFELSGLDLESTLFLLTLGIALGWLGSWLAVRTHLDEIEPT